MDAQAVIMAGGEGVRLRPLTAFLPKPLVPLVEEPVMGYCLRLLKMHGITDVGATLWYRPRDIRRAFARGESYGVKLTYYEEKRPMGTAGSMKMARDHLKGTFFVLSGDGLTDCDLSAALRFHREKKALATLVLRRVHVPLPYGVVLCDPEGRITRFIEKPAWSRVFSNLVNTGIYILEPEIFDSIPDQGAPDFGKDIFPALVQGGLPVYGFETAAYWCDVGDMNAYLSAQSTLLKGETAFSCPGGGHERALIDSSARIEGDSYVGEGARIGPGAVIRDSVIGANATVAAGAVIEHSCLWKRAFVGEKARIVGSVLCAGAAVRQNAELSAGCALGDGARVGPHAYLMPGVKVWPHLKVAADAAVDQSIVSGDSAALRWSEMGVACDTAQEACRIAGAYDAAVQARRVLVGFDRESEGMAETVCGALASRGVRVLFTEHVTAPMLRVIARSLRTDGAVWAGRGTLQLSGRRGAPISTVQTAMINAFALKQTGASGSDRPESIVRLSGAEEIYWSSVVPEGKKPLLTPVAVICPSAEMLSRARRGLERLEARNARFLTSPDAPLRDGEIGFILPPSGSDVQIMTEKGPLEDAKKTMLLLKLLYQKNGRLYDVPGTPRAASLISALLQADDQEACLEQTELMGDGLAATLFLCGALKNGPLDMLLQDVPETHLLSKEAPCALRDKGRILRALCENSDIPHTLGNGVRFQHGRGVATVVPDSYRNAVRVTGESGDSEFAKELCDFYLNRIRQIMNTP